MKPLLLYLAFSLPLYAQQWFIVPGVPGTYHAGLITVTSQGLTGVMRHVRSNGDGTATAYSFDAITSGLGAAMVLAQTNSCYDGNQTSTGNTGSADTNFPQEGPEHYRTYTFTTSCTVPWDYEYDNDPGMTQAFGLLWECHRRANNHASSAGVLDCRTSSNSGATWSSSAVTVISDSTTDCSGHACDLRGASSLSTLPSGSLIVWLNRYDWDTGNIKGTYWSICAASCTAAASWSALTRMTVAPAGIAAPVNTLPYGRLFTMPDGATLGKWIFDPMSTKNFIVFSCDGGRNWNTGCFTQTRLVADGNGASILLPTEETGTATYLNYVMAFSRGCDASGPTCPEFVLTSSDGGLHFAKTTTGFAPTPASGGGPVGSNNQISPILFSSLPGEFTHVFAERELDIAQFRLRALTFDIASIAANPSALNRTQVIWVGIENDWGYPACAMTGATSLACVWYSWFEPGGSVANIYDMTASLIRVRGQYGGRLVNGARIP